MAVFYEFILRLLFQQTVCWRRSAWDVQSL